MTPVTSELDTVTRCRVEGCRLTRDKHHKFRAKKSDPSTCRTCKTKDWHPNHSFEPGYAPSDASVSVACSCGIVARFTTRNAIADAEQQAGWLRLAGWKQIKGEWRCPKDVQRHEERVAKKRTKDPQQIGMFE